GVAAADRIFSILDNPLPAGIAPNHTEAGEYTPADFSIKFKQVSFSYEGDKQAVDQVSFETPSNTTCALVGASGSGKSTLVKLLFGFVQPDHGEITVGSERLSDLPLEKWWEYVSWVPQQPFLFNDTIDANIRIARPDAIQSDVVAAARQAYAHDFILQLPQGYQTVVGERGARLSAGQIQRIVLARAFLKDAPVLILDEPTAHLDPESEAFIHKASERLFRDRTVWVIAHRLPTVVDADQILVVKDGGIVARGDHQTLLQTSSYYQQLVRAYHNNDIPAVTSTRDASYRHDKGGQQLEQRGHESMGEVLPTSETSRWGNLIRLLKLISPYKWMVALSVVLGFLTILCGIGLMSTSAYIISAAALHPSIAALQVPIVGVRFFGISRGLFRYLDRLVSHDVTLRILALLRTRFYQRLEPLAPARISRYRSGDLLNRVIAEIAHLENFYVRALAPPLVAISIIAAMGIFMSQFHASLSVIIVLFLLVAGFGVPLIITQINRGQGIEQLQIQSQLSSVIVDGVQGLADILILGQKENYLSRLSKLSIDLGIIQRKIGWIDALQNASVTLLANMAMWCALFVTIPLVWNNEIAGVYLAVIILAVITSFEAVLPLPQAAQYLERDLTAARRLYEIADQEPEVHDPMTPLPMPETGTWGAKELYFSYPSSAVKPVLLGSTHDSLEPEFSLQGLDFSLNTGKRLAVVGPSGAGKSTIVNLLLRFWEYKRGDLLYDSQGLRSYGQLDVRERQSAAMQRGYIFNTTLRENLLIAYPKASTADLDRAIACAQLENYLKNLPAGYDTVLGEAGARMSSGEQQRLIIARAVLRQAPLVVLDEATAHLDPITERKVLREIIEKTSGRSLLLISHRMVCMEEMDEILVMDQGKIIERGHHTTLLDAGGYYRRMWELQGELLTGTL
ncbi:MAG: thiol reductant ABC exporter subunit CydC, partial [Anaerolineales bacterium]|nr:thiol reductant ABC exporter subunit CydC [Anaerolineales bacterium]